MAIDTPVAVSNLSVLGNIYPIYGTQVRATEYFNPHINGTVFTGAAFLDQQKALVSANRYLNGLRWKGTPATTTQLTHFPLSGETTVPVKVEVAQYEVALLLLEDANFFNQANTGGNERVLRAGPVAIEFFSSTLIGPGSSILPPQVLRLIQDLLSAGSDLVTIAFAGGVANESNVIPRVGNDISRGL